MPSASRSVIPRIPWCRACLRSPSATGPVWAGVPEGLARIDPSSGDVAETVDLDSAQALQIAAGGGAVWVTTIANRAERVEARSGRKTAEFYAGGWVYPVTLDGRAAWVGGLRGLAKLDRDTGASLTSSGAVEVSDGDRLWRGLGLAHERRDRRGRQAGGRHRSRRGQDPAGRARRGRCRRSGPRLGRRSAERVGGGPVSRCSRRRRGACRT